MNIGWAHLIVTMNFGLNFWIKLLRNFQSLLPRLASLPAPLWIIKGFWHHRNLIVATFLRPSIFWPLSTFSTSWSLFGTYRLKLSLCRTDTQTLPIFVTKLCLILDLVWIRYLKWHLLSILKWLKGFRLLNGAPNDWILLTTDKIINRSNGSGRFSKFSWFCTSHSCLSLWTF